jgi:hypothetical protein
MSRPPLEVADIIRAAGEAFIERNRHWLRWKHVKVLRAIERCRTAALGGHLDECTRCGYRVTFSYNSCRDRHCPKCQTAARERWIAARQPLLEMSGKPDKSGPNSSWRAIRSAKHIFPPHSLSRT